MSANLLSIFPLNPPSERSSSEGLAGRFSIKPYVYINLIRFESKFHIFFAGAETLFPEQRLLKCI
jgi:hypothetical protein